MPITSNQRRPGIAEVVIDHPPVNALDVEGWFALADAVTAAGKERENRVVVVRAEGRGFCAGVDIKEIQAVGDSALDRREPRLLRSIRGGVRLRGAGDRRRARILPRGWHRHRRQRGHRGRLRGRDVRSPRGRPRRARRGDPPVATRPPAPDAIDGVHRAAGDRGGAPPATDRCFEWSPASNWSTPRSKSPSRSRTRARPSSRRAKESLNGIDPVDVRRSYRFEQGFTYELHVAGVADEQRAAFVEKRDADTVAVIGRCG